MAEHKFIVKIKAPFHLTLFLRRLLHIMQMQRRVELLELNIHYNKFANLLRDVHQQQKYTLNIVCIFNQVILRQQLRIFNGRPLIAMVFLFIALCVSQIIC